MILDGPYRRNLKIQSYEIVILVVKGLGITGVLPFALFLAERKTYNYEQRVLGSAPFCDKTRQIDLLWTFDYNDQTEWVIDRIEVLKKLDPEKKVLEILCFFLSEKRIEDLQNQNSGDGTLAIQFWKDFHPPREQNTKNEKGKGKKEKGKGKKEKGEKGKENKKKTERERL